MGEGLVWRARKHIKKAAVLLAFVDRKTGPTLILTVRPKTMADHAGQVALPGGKIDPTDTSALGAALREAHEEIGLAPEMTDVFAQSAEYRTGSGFDITPFLASVPHDFIVTPEQGEVDEVFEVPLEYLMDKSNYTFSRYTLGDIERDIAEINWGNHRIWGVTAGIIYYISNRINPSTRT